MEILTEYIELVGKEVVFSHMAEFAEQITIGTRDGSVLMVTIDQNECDMSYDKRVRVLSEYDVLRVLNNNEWLVNQLDDLGVFNLDDYKESKRLKEEENRKRIKAEVERKERKEYERLKKKFEN